MRYNFWRTCFYIAAKKFYTPKNFVFFKVAQKHFTAKKFSFFSKRPKIFYVRKKFMSEKNLCAIKFMWQKSLCGETFYVFQSGQQFYAPKNFMDVEAAQKNVCVFLALKFI